MKPFAELTTKKDRVERLRLMLGTNSKWAVKGLLRIFENQTSGEQEIDATVEHNGIGFTGADANILSSFAKQIADGRQMSEKQMGIIFKRMPKYAKQLEGVSRSS